MLFHAFCQASRENGVAFHHSAVYRDLRSPSSARSSAFKHPQLLILIELVTAALFSACRNTQHLV